MLNELLLKEIDQIILERHLNKKKKKRTFSNADRAIICESARVYSDSDEPFEIEIDPKLDPTFMDTLFKIIDDRGLKDSDVYNKAGIDRKIFSKIRNNDIKVSKNNAIALCLGLELNIEDTEDLLSKAGYALSKSSIRDVVIRQCINSNMYSIREIDNYLIHYKQKTIIKYPE